MIAVNGTIATNLILGNSSAFVTGSQITTGDTTPDDLNKVGNVNVIAQNTSNIDSTVQNTTKSGDTAVGITLAFNTVGWESQNVLFNAVDALLGTQIGTAQPDEVLAYVEDTDVNAFRNVTIQAQSQGSIAATTGNEATSAASALYGATGLSTSGVLASNMVNSDAKAYINYTTATTKKVVANGKLTVDAEDTASVNANTHMIASSTTTNDGGASILNNLTSALLNDYQYTTKSGTQTLNPGDEVRIAPDYGKGAKGGVYFYQGTAGSFDLGTYVLQTPSDWVLLNSTNVVPTGLNVSGSDAIGVGVLVVRNDVRSDVESKITNATVSVGSAELDAIEKATIEAYAESVAIASGGTRLWDGNGDRGQWGGHDKPGVERGGRVHHVERHCHDGRQSEGECAERLGH